MKNKIVIGIVMGLIVISFSFQDRFFEIAKQIEIYNNVFKTLNMNYIYEINPGYLMQKSIDNTLKNLDPYTQFYNEQQMEDARIRREGEYGGIGIYSFNTNKGIIVAKVNKGQPADKAGLKAGDIITNVNGQDLRGLEKNLLSQVLKGSPETTIKLKVDRYGETLNFTFKLDKIINNPVPYYDMIDDETGYIVLTRFVNNKATSEVKKAFITLEEKGMKKLVFDLRGNLGGSLYDAINITNLFIEKGKKVVDTRGKTKQNTRTYKTNNLPLNLEIPIVILIDDRSASASEIVSGALQDYDRAVVIGNRSFGKGLVQRYFELNYGTQMKATISKYYTPSGRCIQELDYANRDTKTGKVPKFSDGTINAFKTTNNRTVYDGGGVTPDIKIKTSKKNEETEKLLKSHTIFYFVNDFIQKNPTADINSFRFTSSNFNDFKTYLIQKDTCFITKQEELFKKAYKSVSKPQAILPEYKKLLTNLRNEKIIKITENQDIISKKIQDEIVERYFYEKGLYEYHLKNDRTIQQAVELLKNLNKYNKILGK